MLQRLSIQHYAIIRSLDIDFSQGLNIITGETGAGKSILIGALGLVLGDRADTSVISGDAPKAIVEAIFTLPSGTELMSLLKTWEIDQDTELMLRREVSATGKSRAFINDTPVNLSQLQELATALVDLHLQFDTLDLGRSDFQRKVIDALCDHRPLADRYGKAYTELTAVRKALADREAALQMALKEQDYKNYLLEELRNLSWKDGEMVALESEYQILSHAEQVKSVLNRVSQSMEEGETPVLPVLRQAVQQLQTLNNYHEQIPGISGRLHSLYVDLQDISSELSRLEDKVQMDEGRLNKVNERMSEAQKLMKKHGLQQADGLVSMREELENYASDFQALESTVQDLQKEVQAANEKAFMLARELSRERRKSIEPFEAAVQQLLHRIGMPNAELKVEISEVPLSSGGIDQIVFLFDANRSGKFESLHKVASGGELSRLMLAIKSLVAGSISMPTLIFDEIDSGISGEAARQVGVLMKELGNRHQVISITHQPQIAARADRHLYVTKKSLGSKIQTQVMALDAEQHVEAIARMMGGEKPSKSALDNAREMVMHP